MEWIVRFELPNGGAGPGTVASDDLAEEYDGILVLLLRDHYCQVSRERARQYGDALAEFEDRNVAVVGVLPDGEDRAAYWEQRYDIGFPILADVAGDGAAEVDADAGSAAMADGTPRFDAFSDVETAVDSLPGIGLLDTESKWPRLVYSNGGETLQGCPEPDEALVTVRDVLGDE